VGFLSEALSDDHDLDPFESDRAELDRWLKQEARRAHRTGTARVTVWTDESTGVVVGYYAITPTQVAPDGLSRKARAGLSGPIPGYLIAKLALSRHLMGGGLGGQLLLDALETVAAAANVAGGRLVVVDAIDERAHGFYEHYGFTPIAGGVRLFARIDAVRASIAHAQCGAAGGDTRAVAAGLRWAVSGEPDYVVILQIEPVAHQLKGSEAAQDAVSAIFTQLGFRTIGGLTDALARAGAGVHCRIDSPRHATIVARLDTGAAIDVPIPHDRPDLSEHLLAEGVASVYITTDSIGHDGLLDRDLFERDSARGHVIGADVVVLRE
jgi:GNAT superfamily N-acetyltransferase